MNSTAEPWSPRSLRRHALRRLEQLGLESPFTWHAYADALRRELAGIHPYHRLIVERTELAPHDFGRWIVVRDRVGAPVARADVWMPRRIRAQFNRWQLRAYKTYVTEYLQLPLDVDDDYLEHLAYHELAHRELGHLPVGGPLNATASESMLCSSNRPEQARYERDAEAFATILQRLGRGWDPAAAPVPRLDIIFDLLS